MDELYAYQIEVSGPAAESELNAAAPLHMTVLRTEPTAVLLTVCTDQSGLIGLVRHLHARGYVLLSLRREPGEPGRRLP